MDPENAYDVLIVIPTAADPDVLVPTFTRMIRHLDGMLARVVISETGALQEGTGLAWMDCNRAWDNRAAGHVTSKEGRTIGAAINAGLTFAETLPPMVVVLYDDVLVTAGWLTSLRAALQTKTVEVWSEVTTESKATGNRPLRSASDYGRIGIAGPMCNIGRGVQEIGDADEERLNQLGEGNFAAHWRETHRAGSVVTASFLSGSCMAFSRECVQSMLLDSEPFGFGLFSESPEMVGHEDRDLCVRAGWKGWRAVVAADTFVGRRPPETEPPSMGGYYDLWRPAMQLHANRQNLVAVYRVKIEVPNDLRDMRKSLIAISRCVDAVAVILTNNPAEAVQHPEAQQDAKMGRIHAADANLFEECAARPGRASKFFREWCQTWLAVSEHARPNIKVEVHRWTAGFNERDERNRGLDIAYKMGADWVLSVDHDELLENRIGRSHFDRWMSHPDPAVQSYDVGFLHHWDSNRLVNRTSPWGDNGAFVSGARGYRFFRVNKAAPQFIQMGTENGLHCGNIPDCDLTAKRVSGLRFRHLGYLRPQDRWRKLARYEQQDPNPDSALVGNTSYAHLQQEENLVMSAYVPCDGIGLHMLVYEGETVANVGRWLDDLYALVDRIVLVWTGEWSPDGHWRPAGYKAQTCYLRGDGSGRSTIRPDIDLWSPGVDLDWPDTGPSLEMARMAEHFGAEWIHKPLADNLAATRNEAIDALQDTPDIGWGLFVDPDEHFSDPYRNLLALRRMAECSDVFGFIFPFINQLPDGSHNESEAVRMHRLDDDRIMRMDGRVHESFAGAQRFLRQHGVEKVLRQARFKMINTGLAQTPEQLDLKLERYHRMTMLELADNPYSCSAWTTLGLHWLNHGCPVVGQECLNRAIQCSQGAYLPYHALALHYGRLCKGLLRQSVELMGNHRNAAINRSLLEVLDKGIPAMPVMGSGKLGDEQEALASLPAFEWPPPEAG